MHKQIPSPYSEVPLVAHVWACLFFSAHLFVLFLLEGSSYMTAFRGHFQMKETFTLLGNALVFPRLDWFHCSALLLPCMHPQSSKYFLKSPRFSDFTSMALTPLFSRVADLLWFQLCNVHRCSLKSLHSKKMKAICFIRHFVTFCHASCLRCVTQATQSTRNWCM